MKTYITRPQFKQFKQLADKIVQKRNTMPILSHILLKQYDNGITIDCTDLENSLRYNIHATGSLISQSVINYKSFLSACGTSGEVSLEFLHNFAVKINDTITLPGVDPQEYPSIGIDLLPKSKLITGFTYNQDLQSALKLCAVSQSTDHSRFNLCCTLLTQVAGQLHIVSTDGHRLTKIEDLQSVDTVMQNAMVHANGIKILSILPTRGTLQLYDNQSLYYFATDTKTGTNLDLTFRLVDGEYPVYNQVIPTSSNQSITINADALKDACSKAIDIIPDKAKGIALTLTSTEDLNISVSSADIGSLSLDLVVRSRNLAPNFKLGLNARYLADACNQVISYYKEHAPSSHPTLTLDFNGSNLALGPVRITMPITHKYLAIIMPMRLSPTQREEQSNAEKAKEINQAINH